MWASTAIHSSKHEKHPPRYSSSHMVLRRQLPQWQNWNTRQWSLPTLLTWSQNAYSEHSPQYQQISQCWLHLCLRQRKTQHLGWTNCQDHCIGEGGTEGLALPKNKTVADFTEGKDHQPTPRYPSTEQTGWTTVFEVAVPSLIHDDHQQPFGHNHVIKHATT